MVTLKLVGFFAALLLGWFAISTYCVCALATLPASLSKVGGPAPAQVAPPPSVS